MFLIRSIRLTPKPTMRRREFLRHTRLSWLSGTSQLEERVLLSALPTSVLAGATLIANVDARTPGTLSQGGSDLYEIQPGSDGRLVALSSAGTAGLELQLSLFDSQGNLLATSDGQAAGQINPIDFHVVAGTEYLEVQSLSGSGSYSLLTTLTPSSDPNQTLTLPPDFQGTGFAPIAKGDFTGNGIQDLVAPDGVHLGTGDGTFEAPPASGALVDPTTFPTALAVGDFNDDGKLDVAVALGLTDSVSISLGNGDGTFQPASNIPFLSVPGGIPTAIVAGDFGNGQTDLAVGISDTGGATDDDVVVLMGNGNGTFTQSNPIPVGLSPSGIATGTFGQDGHFLAVADVASGDVTILTSQGGGAFSVAETIDLPFSNPTSVVAADFGNGIVDLAVTDADSNAVYILEGNGDGTFQPQPMATLAVGEAPYSIVTGDFGNGHVDLAVADAGGNDVSVLLGNGNGTFQPAIHSATTGSGLINSNAVAAGTQPVTLVAADFNDDGRLDLATGNAGSSDITVLLGKGNGSFEEPPGSAVGTYPNAIATGDFTSNGSLGTAVLNQVSNSVTILPGNGDGTFQQALTVALPPGSGAPPSWPPISITTAAPIWRSPTAISTRSPFFWATAMVRSRVPPLQCRPAAAPMLSPRATSPATGGSTWPWPIAIAAPLQSFSEMATEHSLSARRSRL